MSLEVKIGADVSDLKNAIREAQGSLSEFGKSAASVGAAFGADLSIEGATRAIVAFGKEGYQMATELDAKMREVNSLFGRTGEEGEKAFQNIKGGVRELSDELGIAQTDITQGLYNAISAGVPEDNAFEFMKVAAQASIAGVTDINTAVNGLTSNLNAFGLDASKAGEVADGMFQTVKDGKTTFAELSAAVFQVAPAANAAKISMQEVNAAMATLTLSGTPTAVAATQLKAAMGALQKPSEKMNEIFQKLGYKNAQLAIEQKGMAFAMKAVKDATNGDNGALLSLVGSSEAAAAITVVTANNMEVMNQKLENQKKALGGVALAFDEANKASGDAVEDMGVVWDNIKIDFGDKIASAINKMAPYVQMAVDFFKELMANTEPLEEIFQTVWSSAQQLGESFSKLGASLGLSAEKGGVAKGIMEALGVAMKIMLLPTMAIVKSMQLLADVANWIITSVKELWSWIKQLGERFTILKPIIAGLQVVVKTIKAAFDGLVETIKDVLISMGMMDAKADKIQGTSFSNLGTKIKAVADKTAELTKETDKNTGAEKKATGAKAEHLGILGRLNDELTKQNAIIEASDSQAEINAAYKRIAAINLETESIKDRNIELAKPIGLGAGTPTAAALAPQTLAIRPVLDPAALEAAKTGFSEYMGELTEVSFNTSQLMQDAIISAAEAMGAALVDGKNPLEAVFRSIIMSMADFAQSFGKSLVVAGLGVEAAKKLITNPATAVIAGGLLITAGAVMKSAMAKAPALANGGLATSATMAMVGEGRGTSMSNPEVIAPLDKLKKYMGGSQQMVGNVNFKVQGRELVGVLESSNNYNKRTGGR